MSSKYIYGCNIILNDQSVDIICVWETECFYFSTGTPVNATATMLTATAIIAFFTSLDILSNLLSISTLFIFMLVAVGLIVRRYYVSGETSPSDRNKLIIFLVLILGSSIATGAYWSASDSWIGFAVTVPIWFFSTLGLWLCVPQAKKPRVWGVPLVPWLPSISIAMNFFLLGSIDKASFGRFGIWTAILLVYYFFFGLHASYDSAMESKAKAAAGQINSSV